VTEGGGGEGQGQGSCAVTPLLHVLREEVGNLLEGAGIQHGGLAERVVKEVLYRHGQEWSSAGGVAADPNWEFTCLPQQCLQQVVAVVRELEPSANLRVASGYDDDDDDPHLPFPPSSSSLDPQPPSTIPQALSPRIGGGQGSQ
jgi:hypothetical protein